MTHEELLAQCFCGMKAKFRNTVKDQRGVNGATIYVYSVCDKHWDSTPPQLWANLPKARLPEGHQPVNYIISEKIKWKRLKKILTITRGQK